MGPPKLVALKRLTPLLGVYANASRGFRSSDGIISDPTLAPITAAAYEGGIKLDRAGASASAALFRMNVSNEQTFNPVTLASSNGGSSRGEGGGAGWAGFVLLATAGPMCNTCAPDRRSA